MAPLLEMRGIHKRFPGVQALSGVDLELCAGEVVALLGENGAGKSTLIKILSGAQRPDAGTIQLDGRPTSIRAPADARAAGIAVIYQEFTLVPTLSARENVFLGREERRWIDRRRERRAAADLFGRLGTPIDPETPCRDLSVARQQIVEIARALAREARILVMDEPTATLTPPEVERLLGIVAELRARGIAVLYVSHRLEEIFRVADRVVVMRDGRRVGGAPIDQVTRDRLIEMMVGRTIETEYPRRVPCAGAPRLKVRDLRREPRVRGVSFEVRGGEVLGLAGLVGAGRTETARLIFGADRAEAGTVELDGRPLGLRRPRDAIRRGIALLTEDRKAQGLITAHPCRENFALPNLGRLAPLGLTRPARERAALAAHAESLRLKLAGPEVAAATLSGGNQQKLVLAKWLERNCEVLLFDEPTRGIDVGARHEIYLLINRLAAAGKAILMISSDLPEVLGMSDRILVMHQGRIAGEIADPARATQEDVLKLAVGPP
jgi:ABC-type sugar transport system ATPase subunit